ncbi:MAG: glycoside hydrolase family 2 TIM barrel-domain containing protein [Eubacteriales bacterium]|nr:glycoside hydrolase family 2 TIM barrel-domain containing protein [Eubacteriales bacterium]
MKQLYTRWGKQLNHERVLQEYPRPSMTRKSYINLNGYWDYCFTDADEEMIPQQYEGKILVPFSPEALLSGVNIQLDPEGSLWYHRTLQVEQEALAKGGHLLLHFGAVDQRCQIFVNRQLVGRHEGGYLPFTIDITDRVLEAQSDTSFYARGKQKLKRGGMYYLAQSGIWQSVWMEYVPLNYIRKAEAEAVLEEKKVRFIISSDYDTPVTIRLRKPEIYAEERQDEKNKSLDNQKMITDREKQKLTKQSGTLTHSAGNRIARLYVYDEESGKWIPDPKYTVRESKTLATVRGMTNSPIEVTLEDIKLWNCEEPYLYYFDVKTENDKVSSYFAFRSFTIEKDEKNIPRICLNHQPIFLNGVLDQGYWSDGLMTAPSEEALLYDIKIAKQMGFNMIRKHVKVECERFYYHCDRLGMIVWQDMVNGGDSYKDWYVTYLATVFAAFNKKAGDHHQRLLSRKNHTGRQIFIREMRQTVEHLKKYPCIAAWVIFNEGWGQFETEKLTAMVRQQDPTRLIDSASGWYDVGCGDFNSFHNYFFKMKIPTDKRYQRKTKIKESRAAVLSEYGGYKLGIPEHTATEKSYGYGKCKSVQELKARFQKRMQEVQKLIPQGLCASVYTQISDIEDEVNGILTFDREIMKFSEQEEKHE